MKKLAVIFYILLVLLSCNDSNEVTTPEVKVLTYTALSPKSSEYDELISLYRERNERRMKDLDSLNLSKEEKHKFILNHIIQERLSFQKSYEEMMEVYNKESKGMNRQEMLNLKDSLYHVYGMDERMNSKVMKFLKERVPKKRGY